MIVVSLAIQRVHLQPEGGALPTGLSAWGAPALIACGPLLRSHAPHRTHARRSLGSRVALVPSGKKQVKRSFDRTIEVY